MSSMGRNRTPQYYTYVSTVSKGPNPWRIGAWVLAFPLVVLLNALYEAVVAARAYTLGVAAGLGIGPDADALPARRPVEGAGEPAYTQYFFGPAWRDVTHTVTVALRKQKEAAKTEFSRIEKLHFRTPEDDVAADRRNVIKGMALVLGGVAGFLITDVLLAVVLMAQAVALGLLWAGGIVVIYLLRGVDSALLLVRGIQITCPHCYHRIPYPGYRCPECATKHADIRPGRYGMLHRVCRCGKRMPTLLMLGSHRLAAICPHCSRDLEDSAGRAPEVILPVFGAAVAGKTQFLAAVAVAAEAVVTRAGGTVQPADDYSRTWSREVRDMQTRGTTVTKTPEALQPAVSLVLTVRNETRLLKMFDAAGELFRRAERIKDLIYMQARPTFVFIVDPLSVPKLWNEELDEEQRRKLATVRATLAPESVFEQTVQTLHEMRVPLRGSKLAVVVSKADLIAPQIKAARVGGDEHIRQWLAGPLEQGNLVRAISHEFAAARYFLADSHLDQAAVSPSVETFVKWLLADRGVRL
jgi:hypothetical protein